MQTFIRMTMRVACSSITALLLKPLLYRNRIQIPIHVTPLLSHAQLYCLHHALPPSYLLPAPNAATSYCCLHHALPPSYLLLAPSTATILLATCTMHCHHLTCCLHHLLPLLQLPASACRAAGAARLDTDPGPGNRCSSCVAQGKQEKRPTSCVAQCKQEKRPSSCVAQCKQEKRPSSCVAQCKQEKRPNQKDDPR